MIGKANYTLLGQGIIALITALSFTVSPYAEALPSATSTPNTDPDISTPAKLQIGPTGIYCVTEPCPWKGVMMIGEASRHVLWSGTDLPPVEAKQKIRALIADSWKNDACLIVMGQLLGGAFQVSDILGEC